MAMKKFAGNMEEIQGLGQSEALKAMLRIAAHEVMKEEVSSYLGAERHERDEGRRGYRNGYKPRTLGTRLGRLELTVPQVRGTEPYHPSLFGRWERSERALLTTCAEMYFAGVSTRKVGQVLEKMAGFELSAGTVSRVAAELDERLTEFRGRRLEAVEWPYLFVDALYVKVRKQGRVVNVAALLVTGVTSAGNREILTWRLGDVESEDTWQSVFQELRQRGVSGVQWVISDGHCGIRKAMAKMFPGASWQRCWAHFMRNALNKVSHKDKKEVAEALKAARGLGDVAACLQAAEDTARRWEGRYPRLSTQIRDQFEETLSVHGLPSEHQRRTYTTNMIERLNREVKRRTDVVGIFPNEASCDRLIGAVLLEEHEKWQCAKSRYLNMAHLERREGVVTT